MTAHLLSFTIAVSLTLAALLVAGVFAWSRFRRLQTGASLDQLLDKLVAVDRGNVALIAEDYDRSVAAEPTETALAPLDSGEIFQMIGGMPGIEALAANCEILIALAYHVQQWYPEALPVAEQLRLSTREIQWHLERLKGAERCGNLESAFPDYAQRAIATYFNMTQLVRQLYEVSQVPGWSHLQAAL